MTRGENVLWVPSQRAVEDANITAYRGWLAAERGLVFEDYEALWRWSVKDLNGFWQSIWDYFGVQASEPPRQVLRTAAMPGAEWFPGARLNYAEHVLRAATDERPAIITVGEARVPKEITWSELRRMVGSVAASLKKLGVGAGDRVVAYLPNTIEATVGLLACASIGAVWAMCSPEFGLASVVDRFAQLEPRVLIASDGYVFGGREYGRAEEIDRLQAGLPSVEHVIAVPSLQTGGPAAFRHTATWKELVSGTDPIVFEQLPFDHPLWVLYSSGTTGLPKGLVHSHGGIVLEHLKVHAFHTDLRPDDRFFVHSSTSWMVWNYLLSGLLHGATIVQYDGSATYPEADQLWRLAADLGVTWLGMGSAYVLACEQADVNPGREYDLGALRAVLATGAPLFDHAWRWIYERVKPNLWLSTPCGGTDVCTPFLAGNPTLPVRLGEIQCPCLGVALEAWDDTGKPLVDRPGELVVTEPMPSMPVFLWNDADGSRYRDTYFARWSGVWRQGDLITLQKHGGAVVHGRSDATINKGGVRMGSAEIYSAVEALPEIIDSLVVGIECKDGGYYMPLFVISAPGIRLDEQLKERVRRAIRRQVSPRHVPDEIIEVPAVPRNLTGKKLEVPVKRVLMGVPVGRAVKLETVADPTSLDFYTRMAQRLGDRVSAPACEL